MGRTRRWMLIFAFAGSTLLAFAGGSLQGVHGHGMSGYNYPPPPQYVTGG